jgi:plasmid stabilization system protein ParE
MANKLEFTARALADVRAAQAWYEDQKPGLGDRFTTFLEECLEIVRTNPELFEVAYKQYRRTILRKFPYVVFYRHRDDTVLVYGVFHSAQDPRKWRRRLT